MKKNSLILGCLLAGLFIGFGVNRASAQIVAFDSATNYANSAAWTNGSQGGFGFLPWQLTATNASNIFGGRYIDTGSLGISQATKTFGMYGNGSVHPGPFSFAYRELSTPMTPGEVFKIKCEGNGMNTTAASPGYVGFCLRSDDNTNWADQTIISDPNTLFAFYNVGNVDDCFIWDASGANDTGGLGTAIVEQNLQQGVGNGITIEFYLLTATTYQVVVKDATDSTILASYPPSTLAGSGILTLAAFEVNNGGGQNFWINNPEVASVSVVPPVISNLSPSNTATYVTAGGQFSFNVNSEFSAISSNGISLVLNGINESNQMTFTGSGTSNVRVTLNPLLQPNVLYSGTISAADTNGNLSSLPFSFNTWLTEPTNIYIEASDYNYSGGNWINNFTTSEPNQLYGQFDLMGISNIDYYVYNLEETTNNSSPYRAGDLVFAEPATDVDHDNFAADGFTPYDVGYNEFGQWEDYTRALSNNITYAMYARVSGFAGGTIQVENMATPEVSTTSQPGAVLGQFNIPNTGGAQDWTFLPLTDFFSNPVLIRSSGTNTFRVTDINGSGSYNLSYLVLVALTNTATVRPYITSGFPYPGAAGVNPETAFSFTIANDQTSVNPASIQLFINSNSMTSGLTFSNNAAGTVVSYQIPASSLLPAGANFAQAIFSDGSVTITDSWQFSVETIPTLPASWALPLTGSYARGFSELIAKGDDSATNTDFPPTVARAEAQLAGTLTNSSGVPYANEALNGGVYIETNTINYAIDSIFNGIFNLTSPFPDVPAGTTNNVALEANLYAYLTPGVYNFDVYSDDGFQFTAMNASDSTNITLGVDNGGRAAAGSEFSFEITTTGLYPMQLIYFKAQLGGGGVELYSVSSTGGNILLNANTAGSVPVYYLPATAPKLSISLSGNQAVLTWSNSSYLLQSAPAVNGPYTTIAGSTTGYHYTLTGTQEYFRLSTH